MTVSTTAADGRQLHLDTAAGNHVRNWQAWEMTRLELKDCESLERTFAASFAARSEPTPIYNCHGLTFASRRTRIWDAATIAQLLQEDRYESVAQADVLPGDVLVYYGPKGDAEHSGIVIERGTAASFGFPRVCSKWGNFREVLHYANVCDYSLTDLRYYRVKHA